MPHRARRLTREDYSMSVKLNGRSFLTLRDFTAKEIRHLLKLSAELNVGLKRNT
jgi:ornithine carbamoyltransferase